MEKQSIRLINSSLITVSPTLTSFPQLYSCLYHHTAFPKFSKVNSCIGHQYVCFYLCATLFGPMDYSLPGSYVHGLFQARILE